MYHVTLVLGARARNWRWVLGAACPGTHSLVMYCIVPKWAECPRQVSRYLGRRAGSIQAGEEVLARTYAVRRDGCRACPHYLPILNGPGKGTRELWR